MLNTSQITKTIILVVASGLISNFVLAETISDPSTISSISPPSKNTAEKTNTTNKASANNTSPTVRRSQFTTAVVNREPTDNVVTLTNNSDKIYFFTELSNLKGHKITHRWKYENKLMAEINFEVTNDRWRVYSSKKLKPDWIGQWSVELVDESGASLNVENLQVVDAKSN